MYNCYLISFKSKIFFFTIYSLLVVNYQENNIPNHYKLLTFIYQFSGIIIEYFIIVVKAIIITYTILILFINISIAQTVNKGFHRIETGNWLELECQPIDDSGNAINFFCFDQLPEFPGGFDSLTKFIIDTLKYPETAKNDGIYGRVLTMFTVSKHGKVKDVYNFKSIRNDLDSACIKTVLMLPDWKPGTINGHKAVDVRFLLPVRFILKKDEE